MANEHTAQTLAECLKQPGQTTAGLAAILEAYSTLLQDYLATHPEHRADLRRQQEELPDLQRLVIKKFDPVLRGRLQDGLRAFINISEPPPPVPEASPDGAPASTPSPADDGQGDAAPANPQKPGRNIPTLRME